MNKVIIIFALLLTAIGGFVFFQFNKTGVRDDGKVTLANQTITVEVARTDNDKQIGFTKYASLKEGQGMLFLFESSQTYSFWMKNMKFPLDIIFINGDTVVSFVENVPPVKGDVTNPPLYTPEAPSDKVLEVSAGFVKKYNIKKGDKVKIELQK